MEWKSNEIEQPGIFSKEIKVC